MRSHSGRSCRVKYREGYSAIDGLQVLGRSLTALRWFSSFCLRVSVTCRLMTVVGPIGNHYICPSHHQCLMHGYATTIQYHHQDLCFSSKLVYKSRFSSLLLLEVCLHQIARLLQLRHRLTEADADQMFGRVVADVKRADLRHSSNEVSSARVRTPVTYSERPDVRHS